MTETEALALVRKLLADALDAQPKGRTEFVRDLAGRIGELQQTMRTAIVLIDHVRPPEVTG